MANSKKAKVRVAHNAAKPVHLQTRNKEVDPKPTKIREELIKISDVQEKFIWEKADPVSGHNPNIYRRDPAGAIMKIHERGLQSEFGFVLALIDQEGEVDDVNNICAMHWMNARVKRKHGEMWIAPVAGSTDTKETYNELRDHKVPWTAMDKIQKTNLFQDRIVGAKKINLTIRPTSMKK